MREPDDNASSPRRVTRYVQPLGPRVLARIVKDSDRLQSGLFLPDGAKDDHAQAILGEVLEVARALPKVSSLRMQDTRDDNDDQEALGVNVSGIPLGSNILFPKDKGVKLPWDETLRILEVRDILALVEVIAEEDIQ